jgi:hypothetical protein
MNGVAMIFAGYLKLQKAGVLSLLLMAIASSEGIAQNSSNISPLPRSTTPPRKQNVAATEKLTQKVSMNGLPEYSGKQTFIGGRLNQTPIGPQYQEQFIAVEQPNQIVDWYKNALSGYKWEIVDSDASRVHAKKPDGSSITVTVSPFKSPQGRSFVKISYHDYHVQQGANQ